MRYLIYALLVLVISGCASSGLEENMAVMREEFNARLDKEMEASRNYNKRELDAIKSDEKRNNAELQQLLRAEYNSKFDSVGKNMEALKETNSKNIKDINAILIDIQKDFFVSKRISEDIARRLYILERITAGGATSDLPPSKEGEIILIEGNHVTTTLGAHSGVKAGDRLGVYPDSSSRDRIATIQVLVSEEGKSSGEVIEKSAPIERKFIVKPIK
jgi:outer membrane murein-binding lipoprotein Lpp